MRYKKNRQEPDLQKELNSMAKGDSSTLDLSKREEKKSQKYFSILNELKDDKNFEAFFDNFMQLKQRCELEGGVVLQMEKEDDFGNIEYKLKLVNPPFDRVEHLTTQMKFRLEVRSPLYVY